MRNFLHFAPKCPYLKLRGGPVKKANCIICNMRKMKKRIKENVAKLWPWIPWFPIFLISLSCLCHWQEGSWAGTKDSRGRTSYPVRGSSTLLLSGILQRCTLRCCAKILMSYVWCREGNYIYQKSKNVYKYPPFKLEAKTIQNDQESWFRTFSQLDMRAWLHNVQLLFGCTNIL